MTRLLLATDFDGTVADIVDDPGTATLDPSVRPVLERAVTLDEVSVALVSGRDVEDLASRSAIHDAWLVGSHGREIRRPDGSWLIRADPMTQRPDERLLDELREAGFRIEMKKFGLAIHWRERPEIPDDDPRIEAFAAWAGTSGLELIRGRRVAEARLGGADKQEALERIAAELDPERIIYAGDDLTDFGALQWVARRGRAIFAASPEREAPGDPVETVTTRADLIRIFEEELTRPES